MRRWIVVALLLRLSSLVSADITTGAVCVAGYDWATNQKGQSPCLLAGYLQAACGTGDWNVPALPPNNRYNAPNATQANICTCSSVTYSALSMCAACQGEDWLNWPAWKSDCPSEKINIGNYTQDIPKNTSIPQWAYLDPTIDVASKFNLTRAQSVASEHLADTLPVDTSTSNSTGSSKGGSNTGVIVGAVLGSIAVLVMIIFGALFFFRKRHSSKLSSAPSKQYINNWSKKVKAGRPTSTTDDTRSRWEGESAWGEPVATYEVSNIHRPMSRNYSMSSNDRLARSPTPNSKAYASMNSSATPLKIGARTTNEHKITPYILSPIVDSQTSDSATLYGSGSPDHLRQDSTGLAPRPSKSSRSSSDWFKSKRRNSSQSSAHSPPILLPSKIEYSGTKKDITPYVQQLPPDLYPTGIPTLGYYNPDDPSTFPTAVPISTPRGSSESSRPPFPGSVMSHTSPTSPHLQRFESTRHSHSLSGVERQQAVGDVPSEPRNSLQSLQSAGRQSPQVNYVPSITETAARALSPSSPTPDVRLSSSVSPTGRFNNILGRMRPTRTLSGQTGSDFDDPTRVPLNENRTEWSPHVLQNNNN